jgi:integrase
MINDLVKREQTQALDANQITAVQAMQAFDLLDKEASTIANYKARIRLFVSFIDQHGFNASTLLEYRRYLAGRNDYAASTKNAYFTAASIYAGILYRYKMIPIDITKDISGRQLKGFIQSKKHTKDGVQPSEIEQLTDYFKGLGDTKQAKRLKALFSLLIYQGLRQIEIVRLDVTDVDLRTSKAMIRGKGRDDKEPIALHPYTTQAISDYLEAYGRRSGALFTSESNNANGQRITTRSIRYIVKDILTELGIDNSTHGFRHYFTTEMIKHYKGDLLGVAHYTRHNSIEMLQVYNDALNAEQDLPRYISVFKEVRL